MAKKDVPEPGIQQQTKLTMYGEGPWDHTLGRYVGCIDVAQIQLVEGFVVVNKADLEKLQAELDSKLADSMMTKSQKDRVLEILEPELSGGEPSDLAVAVAAVIMERDPLSFFTKDPPAEPGWYWYKESGQPGLLQLQNAVVDNAPQLCMKGMIATHAGIKDSYFPITKMRGSWCGPIKAPQGETL